MILIIPTKKCDKFEDFYYQDRVKQIAKKIWRKIPGDAEVDLNELDSSAIGKAGLEGSQKPYENHMFGYIWIVGGEYESSNHQEEDENNAAEYERSNDFG